MAGIKNIIDSELQGVENYIGRTFDQILAEQKSILDPSSVKNNGTRSTADSDYYTNISQNGNTIQNKKDAAKSVKAHATADLKTVQKKYDDGEITQTVLLQEQERINNAMKTSLAAIDSMVESEQGAASTRGKAIKQAEARLTKIAENYNVELNKKKATLNDIKRVEASMNKELVSAYEAMGKKVAKIHSERAKSFVRATKTGKDYTADKVVKQLNEQMKTLTPKKKAVPARVKKPIPFSGDFSLADVKKAVSSPTKSQDKAYNQDILIAAQNAAARLNETMPKDYGVNDEELSILEEARSVWGSNLKFVEKRMVDEKGSAIKKKQQQQYLTDLGGADKVLRDAIIATRKSQGLDTDESFFKANQKEIEQMAKSISEFRAPISDKKSAIAFIKRLLPPLDKYTQEPQKNLGVDVGQLIREHDLGKYFGIKKYSGDFVKTKAVSGQILSEIYSELEPSSIPSPNAYFTPHINGITSSKVTAGVGSEGKVRSAQEDIDEEEMIWRAALNSLKRTPYKNSERSSIITETDMEEIVQSLNNNKDFTFSEYYAKDEKEAKKKLLNETKEKILAYRAQIMEQRIANNTKKVSTSARISGAAPKKLQPSSTLSPYKSNKRIVDNFKSLNRGVDVSNLMGKTIEQYQQDAIKAFGEQGVNVSFNGNKVSMQYGDSAPVEFDFASLAEGNTITKGGQKYLNRTFADTDWYTDSNGGMHAKNILIDAFGSQFKNFANMASRKTTGENGEEILEPGAIVQALMEGNTGGVQSMMANLVARAIGKAPANMSKSVAKEINEDSLANKTDEQAYVKRGTFNMNQMFESFIRNKNNVDFFQAYLDSQPGGKHTNLKNRELEVPSQLLSDIGLLYDLMSRGDVYASKEIAGLQDNHIAKILYNGMMQDGKYQVSFTDKDKNVQTYDTSLQHMFSAMQEYIGVDLIPVFDSIKEEAVLGGDRTVASANDLMPFGWVKNSSSRAQDQVNNYLERVNKPTSGTKSVFGSRAATQNGIDTQSAERTLYTGGMASDVEIADALKQIISIVGREKLNSYLEAEGHNYSIDDLSRIMSTEEGGMIVGSDFAKELAAYLPQQEDAYDEYINLEALQKLGVTMEQISALQKGELIPLNQILDSDDFKFTDKSKLKKGDKITGLQKTEEGLKLRYNEYKEAGTGTKALIGEVGGRQTLRVIPQLIMDMLSETLGMKGAQYLTEHTHDSTKKGQFDLMGRYNEIIANAQRQGLTVEQILKAFEGTQYENAMRLNEQGQIESTVFADGASGKVLYEDVNTGEIKSFFDYDAEGKANEGQVARAIIEDMSLITGEIEGIVAGTKSDMEMFEDKLAATYEEQNDGAEYEKSNKKLYKAYVNQANQYDYHNAVGSGNDNVIEDVGRPRYDNKARIADRRVIAQAQLKYKDDAKALAELEAFLSVEEKSIDRMGKQREEAIKDRETVISALDRSFKHDDYGYSGKANFSFSGQGKEGAVSEDKSVVVGLNDKGEITFTSGGNTQAMSGITTRLNYDEEGNTGYTTQDYNNSLTAVLQKYMKEHKLSQAVVQHGDQKMVMPLLGDTQLHNGNMLISRTSGVLHGMFTQKKDGSFYVKNDAFDSARNNLAKYATDKDSQLVKTSVRSHVANARWGELVGTNTADKATNLADANAIYVTEDSLRTMLSTERTATEEDLMNNVQQLLMKKYSSEGTFEETRKALDAEFTKLKEMDQKQLKDYEQTIINDLIGGVKNGKVDLSSQLIRYPLTSGEDVRYTQLKINNAIGNEAGILISRGLADTVNGDYDGDHTQIRALGLDYAKTYEEYYKAAMAEKKIVGMHTEVARGMEERHGEAERADNPHSAKKQVEMVKDMSDRRNDQVVGMMSKQNKKYVGMFSNISTAMRSFMEAFNAEEIGAVTEGRNANGNAIGDQEIAYASLARAFTEMFEQDSISAKKVFERMFAGGQYEMDELQGIYNMMREGNFDKAITTAINKGILKVDENGNINSRQWGMRKNSLKAAGIDINEVFKGKSELDILKGAMGHILKLGTDNKLEGKKITGTRHAKAVIHRADIAKTQTKQQERLQEQIRKDAEDAVNAAEQAKKVAEEAAESADNAENKAEEVEAEVEGGGIPPKKEGSYRALKTTNAKDYEFTHKRILAEWDGSSERVTGGDAGGVSASQIDDITGYIRDKGAVEDWGKAEKVKPGSDMSSALGTYGHKIAELLNKHQVKFTKELDAVLTKEEKIELEQIAQSAKIAGLGEVDNATLAEYAKGAEALVAAGRKKAAELFGENAMTEYSMGGVFRDSEGNERTFSGEADVMAMKENGSGFHVGDYKFSSKNDPRTVAKRIMQQSIYLAMYEKELEAQFEAIQNGADASQVGRTATQIEKELNAIRKGNTGKDGAENTANIFRRTEENTIEVIQAKLLNTEHALEYMAKASEYVQLQQQIEGIAKKYGGMEFLQRQYANGNQNAIGDWEQIDSLMTKQNAIKRSKAFMSVNDQLLESGIINHEGQLFGPDGILGDLFSGWNDTGKFETEMQGMVTKGGKSHGQEVSRYLANYKRQMQIEKDMAKTQLLINESTGSTQRMYASSYRDMESQLSVLKQQQAVYDREQGTLNGIKLSQREIARLEQQALLATQRRDTAISKMGVQMKAEQGLLDKMLNGFKQQFSNFLGMNLTYQLVGEIRRLFSEIVQLTQQLDANMVDLQIASGGTREEVEGMVKGFNDLAMKTGRSTSEVATAANDWLRAGYKGDDATKLTEASMQLSTLGMMEANDATTALISSLKGWKLSAEEVSSVVDKLVTLDMSYAISAGDLASAMARANNSARVAGSTLDNFMSYITVGADVTQRAPESIGEAWKTLYSRLGNRILGCRSK